MIGKLVISFLLFLSYANQISYCYSFRTGDSLQYAFIEFSNSKECEAAYFKMDNVLIDDRRIHVDFSQSVSKLPGGKYNQAFQDFRRSGNKRVCYFLVFHLPKNEGWLDGQLTQVSGCSNKIFQITKCRYHRI